jgi:hypothetical protein
MVGGTAPQVMAHSATTRNFEITDEIEIKDDLDTKPDDERSTTRDSLVTYFQDVELFLKTLRKLGGTKQFDLAADSFEVTQTTQLPCVAANKTGSYTANTFVNKNEVLRPWLESFSKLLTDGYSLGDCLPSSRFGSAEATDSRFNFKLDGSGFSVEVAVKKNSPEGAKLLAGDLAQTYELLRKDAADTVRQRLLETTQFRSENDQVFVITNLPRAALDTLLAKDAK